MKTTYLFFIIFVASLMAGCGSGNPTRPANSGPSRGTLGLDNLTAEQQIAKVQNDNSIPEQYKQTYINSVRAKSGAPH